MKLNSDTIRPCTPLTPPAPRAVWKPLIIVCLAWKPAKLLAKATTAGPKGPKGNIATIGTASAAPAIGTPYALRTVANLAGLVLIHSTDNARMRALAELMGRTSWLVIDLAGIMMDAGCGVDALFGGEIRSWCGCLGLGKDREKARAKRAGRSVWGLVLTALFTLTTNHAQSRWQASLLSVALTLCYSKMWVSFAVRVRKAKTFTFLCSLFRHFMPPDIRNVCHRVWFAQTGVHKSHVLVCLCACLSFVIP